MDLMPIPFSFHSIHMLEKVGTRTIHVSTSIADTKHTTLAAEVTASNIILAPFSIFKGKMGDHIARKEFWRYPNVMFLCMPG